MSTASERIKEGMMLRGLKQVDLVEKTGISKGALSSYISGRYVPKQNNTFLIAKALGRSCCPRSASLRSAATERYLFPA